MKTTKIVIPFVLFFYIAIDSKCQDDPSKLKIRTTIDSTEISKKNVNNKLNLYKVIENLIKNDPSLQIHQDLVEFANYDALKQKSIVVVKHQFKYKGDSLTQISDKEEVIILHKDKNILDSDSLKWSDYLLNTKDVLLVFIGGSDILQNSKIRIVEEKSFFTTSLLDMVALAKAVINPTMTHLRPSLPITFVLLNPKKIKSPCTIKISHEEQKDSLAVLIHERNFFAFHAGVSGQQLNKNQIKLQNQQLIVALDSTQKKDWASNLAVFLTFYPFGGRDIDRFDPIHKIKLSGKKWENILYKLTLERIGVFGGVKMSKDPIQNIYFGGSYAFSKALNFNIGWVWANTLTPSITNVGNINSFADAVKYADRKYERQLFIGVSFAPSSVTEILGLNKDKDK